MKSDLFQILHIFRFYSKEQQITFFLGKFEFFKTVGKLLRTTCRAPIHVIYYTFFCKIVETVNLNFKKIKGKIALKSIKNIFEFFKNILI